MPIEQFTVLLQSEDNIEEIIAFIEAALDTIDGEDNQIKTGDMLAAVIPAVIFQSQTDPEDESPAAVPALKDALGFDNIIRLSRDPQTPEPLQDNLYEYFASIETFAEELFDDNGAPVNPVAQDIVTAHDATVALFLGAIARVDH